MTGEKQIVMRAAVVVAPGRLEWMELPLPVPTAGQVRIRSAYCGICATDLAMLAGSDRIRHPAVLGHEWSGVVDAVGPGVDPGLVGLRCVAENVWAEGGEVGFEHSGAYGECFLTQARLLQPLPRRLTLKRAALIEPLAVCVRAVRRLRLESRREALVYGDGVIGLLFLLLLVREGVRDITLVGGRPGRLARARQVGARHVIDYHGAADRTGAALADLVRRATGREDGFANLVEASGSSAALESCFALGAPEAHVLIVGDYAHASARVPWQRWLHREFLVASSNASAGAWPEAVRLAAELPLDTLATHTVPAAEVHRGMELMRSRDSGAIRVLLDWGLEG